MLPTRHGLYFAVALTAMLLTAVNYGNTLVYLFTFLVGSMVMVSMLSTHRNLAGLRLCGASAAPVFAGGEALFRLRLHNPASLHRPAVWLHAEGFVRRIDLLPRQSVEIGIEVPVARRGYRPLPPLTLSSAFPLGLLYSWSKRIELPARCLVYPRPLSLRPLPRTPDPHGGQEVGQRTQGDDFVGLRAYHMGDPPRHVHWKSAARGQELHTKCFGGAGGGKVWLAWEELEGLDDESRLGQLTQWVLEADHANMCYGLRLPGLATALDRGEGHRRDCLKALALWRSARAP